MPLEEVIRELLKLAGRKPLSGEDLKRAKRLMAELKGMGFKNREIAELTKEGWSEATVKLYTKGVKVKDPSPKNTALNLLGELVERGLTLKDIEEAVEVTRKCEERGLTLEDALNLLDEAKSAGLKVEDAIRTFREMKEGGSTFEALREALAYKAELESKGLSLEDLRRLSDALKKLGGYTKALEALEAYGGVEAVKAEAEKLSKEKAGLEEQVKRLEERKAALKPSLDAHEELERRGFNHEALMRLREASSKYGGVEEVLEAVNKYGNVASLNSELSRLKDERDKTEASLRKLNADHAHLQTLIGMCDNLLYEHKFSVSAIERLYEVAKRHGKPIEVLKAIEKYGEIKALEKEAEKLSAMKEALEARAKELEARVEELRGLAQEIKGSVSGILKPLLKEVEEGVKAITEKYNEAIGAITSQYEEYAEKLGNLKAEAGKLEGALEIARIVQTMVNYPTEAREFSLDYDLLMLKAIIQHCNVKSVDPEVEAGDVLSSKYYNLSPYVKVKVSDLLKWAERGLTQALGGR